MKISVYKLPPRPIDSFVYEELTYGYDDNGIAERADRASDRTAKAFSLLIQRLVEKGTIELDDLSRIIGHKPGSIARAD